MADEHIRMTPGDKGDGSDGRDTGLDRLIANLVLTADNAQPLGPEPTADEMAALVDGRIDDARRQEILSHIARNPRHFQIWRMLATSDISSTTTPPESARATDNIVRLPKRHAATPVGGRFGTWTKGLAIAASLAVIAFIFTDTFRHGGNELPFGVTNLTADGINRTLDEVKAIGSGQSLRLDFVWIATRGGSDDEMVLSEGERHLLSAVAASARDTDSTLGTQSPDLARLLARFDASHRSPGNASDIDISVGTATGRLAVTLLAACGSSPSSLNPTFWQTQRSLIENLVSDVDKAGHYPSLAGIYSDWATSASSSQDIRSGLCKGTAKALTRFLH